MLGPILYWDLVRHVRRPAHFQQRAALAALLGAFVFGSTVHSDSRLVGSIAHASEVVAALTFAIQTLAIYLLVPAGLAGSICDDRLQGRLVLLLATPLSRRQIVIEKLLVGVGLALLAMLTALPFALLGPILGGVEPNAVLRAELAALVETIFVAAATLLISSRSVNGSEAMVKSFGALFALRYAAPYLEPLASYLLPGSAHSPTFWAWATAISPAATARAAWLTTAETPGGPSFVTLLLVPLGLAALAFEMTVRSLDLRPEHRLARRPPTAGDDRLLDADPLVWRAVRLRVYDRNGVWRRATFMLAVVFTVMVWAGAPDVVVSAWTAFVILGVVFVVNATLPTQWLINERKSGWFRELQLTPLTMDDVLRASVIGTRRHLRPLWLVAAAALTANVLAVGARSLFAGIVISLLLYVLVWPTWLAFWIGVEMGFKADSVVVALLRNGAWVLYYSLVWAVFLGFLFFGLVPLLAGLTSQPFSFSTVVGIAAVVVPLVGLSLFYGMVFRFARAHALKSARTALFVTEKTRNFGAKGSDAAWEDWVGVTRDMGKERPVEVYNEPLPELTRPRR